MQSNKMDAYKGKTPKIDLSEQIEIMISCEEDPNIRWGLYESWQRERKRSTFDEAVFLDEIISNTSVYLD